MQEWIVISRSPSGEANAYQTPSGYLVERIATGKQKGWWKIIIRDTEYVGKTPESAVEIAESRGAIAPKAIVPQVGKEYVRLTFRDREGERTVWAFKLKTLGKFLQYRVVNKEGEMLNENNMAVPADIAKETPAQMNLKYGELETGPSEPVKGEQAGMLGVAGKYIEQKRPWTPGQMGFESYAKYVEAMDRKYSLAELQKLCRKRGVSSSGDKKTLVRRLFF